MTFECAGATLFGTLDTAQGPCGLLIVSGGNEIRSGAWSGQAQLAARVAGAGHPVFRYDRRGVGDSSGENHGFLESREDIAAALAAFRAAAPRIERIVAFGNCDAASALMLFGADLELHALVLANPWTVDGDQGPPVRVPSALHRRYLDKLLRPGEWKRLLTGGVDLGKLTSGIRQAVAPVITSVLASEIRAGLASFAGPATIVLAERDRTAQLFRASWQKGDERIVGLNTASHSFSDARARDWLFERVTEALR